MSWWQKFYTWIAAVLVVMAIVFIVWGLLGPNPSILYRGYGNLFMAAVSMWLGWYFRDDL